MQTSNLLSPHDPGNGLNLYLKNMIIYDTHSIMLYRWDLLGLKQIQTEKQINISKSFFKMLLALKGK